MVCLDPCNRVSAVPRDDLSSFGRGLVKRKTMHAISIDKVIGASDNFLTIARGCSPPDQPPAAANAPSIAEMDVRIERPPVQTLCQPLPSGRRGQLRFE